MGARQRRTDKSLGRVFPQQILSDECGYRWYIRTQSQRSWQGSGEAGLGREGSQAKV